MAVNVLHTPNCSADEIFCAIVDLKALNRHGCNQRSCGIRNVTGNFKSLASRASFRGRLKMPTLRKKMYADQYVHVRRDHSTAISRAIKRRLPTKGGGAVVYTFTTDHSFLYPKCPICKNCTISFQPIQKGTGCSKSHCPLSGERFVSSVELFLYIICSV